MVALLHAADELLSWLPALIVYLMPVQCSMVHLNISIFEQGLIYLSLIFHLRRPSFQGGSVRITCRIPFWLKAMILFFSNLCFTLFFGYVNFYLRPCLLLSCLLSCPFSLLFFLGCLRLELVLCMQMLIDALKTTNFYSEIKSWLESIRS